MGGGPRRRGRIRGAALAVAAGLSLPVAAALAQQGAAPPAPRLQFDLSSGLEVNDNPRFVADPGEGGVSASGRLGLTLADETPLSGFVLAADVALRAGLSGDVERGLDAPSRKLRFDYDRRGALAELSVSALADDSRIDFLRPLSDFIDDGVFTPPDDIEDLTGTGWRRQLSLDALLTAGRGGPVTWSFGLGTRRIDYRETTDPDLTDNRRDYADLGLGFDLTGALRADVGLRYEVFTDADQDEETLTLRTGLQLDRPDGALRLRFSVADVADGTRLTLQGGRRIERPWGSIDADLGATRDEDGNANLTGTLRLAYALPQGEITASLNRAVVSGEDAAAELRTTAALGLSRTLTPRASMSLGLNWISSEAAATGTDFASLGLGYSYALTEDWGLSLGYSHRMRDEDGTGRATQNAVTLSLTRSFATGF